MKLIFFLTISLWANSNFAQSYYSEFIFVQGTELFSTGPNSMNLLEVDTNDVSKNELQVIVSNVSVFSNENYAHLTMIIRKTNITGFIKEGDKSECFIDYKSKTIYDLSSKSYYNFSFPTDEDFSKEDVFQEITFNDSISSVSFHHDSQLIKIETKKNIPSSIRSVSLMNNNEWGISNIHTSKKLVELLFFIEKDYDFEKQLKRFQKKCKQKGDAKKKAVL